jgi:hypothetical protein
MRHGNTIYLLQVCNSRLVSACCTRLFSLLGWLLFCCIVKCYRCKRKEMRRLYETTSG